MPTSLEIAMIVTKRCEVNPALAPPTPSGINVFNLCDQTQKMAFPQSRNLSNHHASHLKTCFVVVLKWAEVE